MGAVLAWFLLLRAVLGGGSRVFTHFNMYKKNQTTAGTPTYLIGVLNSVRSKSWGKWGLGTLIYRDLTGKEHKVTITGPLAGLAKGERVEAAGSFVKHDKYGEQFEAIEIMRSKPSRREAVMDWLEKTVPHLGPERSRVLVDTFGTNLFELFDADDGIDKLVQISGITDLRAIEMVDAWKLHKERFRTFERLVELGLVTGEIKDVFDSKLMLSQIEADPLVLYYNEILAFPRLLAVVDLSFPKLQETDELALAALHSVVVEVCKENGSTGIPLNDALRRMGDAYDDAPTEEELIEMLEKTPGRLELYGGLVQPGRYSRAEHNVAQFILQRLKR